MSESDVIAEAKQKFDHELKLSGYQGPLLLMHTEGDGLVDISHAERKYKWAASVQKQLVRFPFGNHNSIMGRNREEYFNVLRAFVRMIEETRSE